MLNNGYERTGKHLIRISWVLNINSREKQTREQNLNININSKEAEGRNLKIIRERKR